jgi:hypothetical protein
MGGVNLRKITRIALALFVGTLIIYESNEIPALVDVALKAFGKESAKLEAKKNK